MDSTVQVGEGRGNNDDDWLERKLQSGRTPEVKTTDGQRAGGRIQTRCSCCSFPVRVESSFRGYFGSTLQNGLWGRRNRRKELSLKNLYQFRQGVLRIRTMVLVVVGSDESRTFIRISLVLCNICHGRKRRRSVKKTPRFLLLTCGTLLVYPTELIITADN